MNTTWRAARNPRFEGISLESARQLHGVLEGGENLPHKNEIFERESYTMSEEALPNSFDSRDKYPMCSSLIGHIRDQEQCG
jgi:hypothetical protein